MIAIRKQSVKSLLMKMYFGNQHLSTGTCFLIKKGTRTFAISNRHNFTGRDQITEKPISNNAGIPDRISILHNSNWQLGSWIEKIEILHYKNGTPRWLEHPHLGPRADIAALELTDLSNVQTYDYSLEETPSNLLSAQLMW